MDEALHRLARAAGIESGYWDGLGTRRDLSDDTAQALLSALGFDPDHALDAQATALEQRAFSHTLPPVLLVAPGAVATLELSLPLQRATALPWRVVLESGCEECGQGWPERIDAHEAHAIDGIDRARFRGPSLVHRVHGRDRSPAR